MANLLITLTLVLNGAVDDRLREPDDPPDDDHIATALLAEPTVEPAPGTRFLGTLIGSVVGDAAALLVWFGATSALTGFKASGDAFLVGTISLGALAALGVAPLGVWVGNNLAGGKIPYWAALVGTAAGIVAGGGFAFALRATDLYDPRRADTGMQALGAASVLLASLMCQVLVPLLGE